MGIQEYLTPENVNYAALGIYWFLTRVATVNYIYKDLLNNDHVLVSKKFFGRAMKAKHVTLLYQMRWEE